MDIKQANEAMRALLHANGEYGEKTVTAVLDTGTCLFSPMVKQIKNPIPEDSFNRSIFQQITNPHGTMVAGAINLWCPKTEILGYNVINQMMGYNVIDFALMDVIRRAKEDKLRHYLVNMSFVMDEIFTTRALIQELVAMGVPVFASAGNDGSGDAGRYPGSWPEPICIASAMRTGTPRFDSNWHNEMDFIDLGDGVPTVDMEGKPTTFDATSAACPTVLAKAIHIWNRNPSMSETDLYEAMKESTDLVGQYSPRTGYGWVKIKAKSIVVPVTPIPTPPKEVENMNLRETIINAVLESAKKYLGTPYSKDYRDDIWPGGYMDCSTYTAAIWALAGFPLLDGEDELRTSMYQVSADGFDLIYPASKSLIGKQLPSPNALLSSYGAQPGDIVFWNFDMHTTRYNKITHVGSILDNQTMIHTANPREKCCTKPLSYGTGSICAIIRLRNDITLPKLPNLAKGDGPKWMVRMLQIALNLKYGFKLDCDGVFGTGTEIAVLEVNLKLGRPGKTCTDVTWSALGFVNNGVVDIPAPSQRDLKLTMPRMIGPDVIDLQKRLISMGYDLGPSGADGDYGPKTDTAVKVIFELAKRLTNGVVDDSFRKLIGI